MHDCSLFIKCVYIGPGIIHQPSFHCNLTTLNLYCGRCVMVSITISIIIIIIVALFAHNTHWLCIYCCHCYLFYLMLFFNIAKQSVLVYCLVWFHVRYMVYCLVWFHVRYIGCCSWSIVWCGFM